MYFGGVTAKIIHLSSLMHSIDKSETSLVQRMIQHLIVDNIKIDSLN